MMLTLSQVTTIGTPIPLNSIMFSLSTLVIIALINIGVSLSSTPLYLPINVTNTTLVFRGSQHHHRTSHVCNVVLLRSVHQLVCSTPFSPRTFPYCKLHAMSQIKVSLLIVLIVSYKSASEAKPSLHAASRLANLALRSTFLLCYTSLSPASQVSSPWSTHPPWRI